jgi:hypothetical protein
LRDGRFGDATSPNRDAYKIRARLVFAGERSAIFRSRRISRFYRVFVV